MNGNYEKLVGLIAKSSGLKKEEIESRILAKQKKISGLISKEGAAQIIAAELGISFDGEKLKINELMPGMKKVNVVGKVINLFPVRSFNKNGKESKVANMIIADDTSNIKAVLWDFRHIELIENGKIVLGNVVEISNASMRENEIHLGNFSEFKLSSELIDNVNTQRVAKEKRISEFNISDTIKTRAFIVQMFEPKFFHVCVTCKKKATNNGDGFTCEAHGKVVPEKRALINIVLDDGTGTIRSVLFNEAIQKLGLTNLEDYDSMSKQKEKILGKEMFFHGTVKNNKFFNNPELVIDTIEEIEVDNLLVQLEKN